MNKYLKRALIGLAIGSVVCIAGWVTESRAGPAPNEADPLMASSIIFELGAMPLRLVTGESAYKIKASAEGAGMWYALDAGQVLLNWLLIALIVGWLGSLAQSRFRARVQ